MESSIFILSSFDPTVELKLGQCKLSLPLASCDGSHVALSSRLQITANVYGPLSLYQIIQVSICEIT